MNQQQEDRFAGLWARSGANCGIAGYARCFVIVLAFQLVGTVAPTEFLVGAEVQHSFLVADSSQKRIAIIGEDGTTNWEMKIGPLHDLHKLENGNLLLQVNWTKIVEIDPANGSVVWSYDANAFSGAKREKVEVHAFQRLEDGTTMLAVSGIAKIIEVDGNGKVTHEVELDVPKPHPHTDTRLVRKLQNGNYLVCHESQGRVTEYNASGEIEWDYRVPLFGRSAAKGHGLDAFGNKCFSALRLESGNTLIATGNGHSIIEVSPEKEIVWKLTQDELEGIRLAW
ncbi:MAG: PQQ-binding-like beta-propeller repeat protein, partial [Planctomycetota bacterium]